MSQLVKIDVDKACQITSRYELDGELVPLLKPGMTPADFIELMLNQKNYIECVRFIAHALPKREGVWWACLATRFTHTPDTAPLNQQTLKVTETWVRQPTEDLRLQAEKLAVQAKYQTPDSWAAMAAFWSVGSIIEGDQPMPAPPYLFAQAITGAVALSALAETEEDINNRYLRFISQGLDLASGGKGMIHKDPFRLLSQKQSTETV